MEKRVNSRDRDAFHDVMGHKTEDLFTLKDAINKAVRNDKLIEYEKWSVKFGCDNKKLVRDEEGNYPMVVSAIVVRFKVKRILVDSGSAVEVLSWQVYQNMGLKEQALSEASPLYVLRGDHPMAYNTIFGRPMERMVVATFCMKIKFPTKTSVGFLQSDQRTASGNARRRPPSDSAQVERAPRGEANKAKKMTVRTTNGRGSEAGVHELHGRLLRIQSDFARPKQPREDSLHHQGGALLLSGHAFQPQECRSNLSKASKRIFKNQIGHDLEVLRLYDFKEGNKDSSQGWHTSASHSLKLQEHHSHGQKSVKQPLKNKIIPHLPSTVKIASGRSNTLSLLDTSEETITAVFVKSEGVHQFPLRSYFQDHSVVMVTNQPMKEVLSKADTSGRVMKWSIELSEYGIDFTPRTAIKGQKSWLVYVDGSATKTRSGAGALIIDPSGNKWLYGFKFGFQTSNNITENEALVSGLELAHQLGAKDLIVHTYSQLVAKQMNEDLLGRHPTKGKILLEHRETLSYDTSQVLYMNQKETWMMPIIRTLQGEQDNQDMKEIAKLQRKAARFEIPRTIIIDNGETTFSLFYGAEVVIPTEVGLRSHRTQHFDEEANQEAVIRNLNLMDELREAVEVRNAARAQQVAHYHNSKVRNKQFQVGDFVLRNTKASLPAS
ncbi:Retrovirus-related Pol polyprotein from transposon 17.6 [Gossypium australe]|uniref:Retrovirus-related Pol polyprotein from transposon 17.6 n=1 Tax=Gossypium australe TaxID=47621 RepID=A0A5B6WSJ9_9ROSI|nr:Retrovirus-related Pol polyprotein from transposon 17.6 [Gossypium australe]